MDISGADINDVSDLLSPSEFPITSLGHHVQMNMRRTTVY